MQAQRGHLDRDNGDLEVGVADLLKQRPAAHHSAPIPAPPTWLVNWERKRPALLMECIAECIGVFFYVFSGIGASAAFLVTTAANEPGYGSLLTIAFAYAFGIAFAIIVAAPTSGGHLSPSFTVAFFFFKGFPARKVPFYIFSQLLGGFLATLCVYGIYNQQFKEVVTVLEAVKPAQIFSPAGPAGILALFPGVGQELRWAFLNEVIANLFLSILVFSVLDLCNFFVALPSAPWTIGLGYFVIIAGFAVNSVSLNAARDVGGRFACAAIYGSKCFTASSGYTALAALTTFPVTLIGAFIHTLFLSDTARMIVNAPPAMADQISIHNEQRGFSTATRAITRESVWRDNGSPTKQSYSPADEHHQWQRDNGDAAPLSSTTSSHHHETGAAAAAVTPKEHHHHEPAAVAAKEAVTPSHAEPTTSTTSSSTTPAPSTTVDAPPANAERTPSLNKTDSHAAPATTDAAPEADAAAAAKPDDGEYHGEHAGKLGYGPQAPSGGGLPDRLKAMEEKIKGKLTHNPDLVQQGHERDTGELAEKRRQYDASHDDGAFSKPTDGEKPTPAAGAKDDKKVADDVRESGHAASADAATAGTKSA
ncbi:hypothetical protein JCM9279_006938 [Rhodotorula babjevae]